MGFQELYNEYMQGNLADFSNLVVKYYSLPYEEAIIKFRKDLETYLINKEDK